MPPASDARRPTPSPPPRPAPRPRPAPWPSIPSLERADASSCPLPGRIVGARLAALGGLGASLLLVLDGAGRGDTFCPLASACETAAQSELGAVLGVPTSHAGLAAFALLMATSLLPLAKVRGLLRLAGALALVAGLGLLVWQARVLGTFCPLCVVADAMGIVVGILLLTWPAPQTGVLAPRPARESAASRVAWIEAALLMLLIPFAWPREAPGGWIEIPEPGSQTEVDRVPVWEGRSSPLEAGRATTGALAVTLPEPAAPVAWQTEPVPSPAETAAPEGTDEEAPAEMVVEAARGTRALPEAPPPEAPPHAEHEPPRTAAPPPPVVRVVEYLNPFCTHCRATHRRLEEVLASEGHAVQRVRIYTWGGRAVPSWARALAFAERFGRETLLFEELLRARDESAREIHAAAGRAGLPLDGLDEALAETSIPPRLARDRQAFLGARLEVLPTLDVGRRRLLGAQSAQELRHALRVAAQAAAVEGGRSAVVLTGSR